MQENNNPNLPTGASAPQGGRADYGSYTPRGDFRQAAQAQPQQAPHQDVVMQASAAAQRMVAPAAPTIAPISPQPVAHAQSAQAPQRPELSFQPDVQPAKPAAAPAPAPQPSQPIQQNVPPHEIGQHIDLSRKDSFAPPAKQRKKFSFKFPSFKKAAITTSILVMVVGAGGIFNYVRSGDGGFSSVAGISDTKTQDDEGGLLSSAKPHEDGNPPSVEFYRTANSYPKVIRVPKMNIESRILPLSIAPTGALKSPATIFDAGWYKDSARIGEPGAMVINGHTAGEYNKGIFYSLDSLNKGDLIEIVAGDGQSYVYTVQETVVYKADDLDMSRVMVPYRPGETGLTLINAGGRVDPTTEYFEDRVVVFAVL